MTAEARIGRRIGRLAALVRAGAVLAAMLAGLAPAAAQVEGAGEAVDIRQEINDHFVGRMPYGWWISIPEKRLSGFHVTVHIPDWWKGNPNAAVMDLCPDRRSRIWSATPRLSLTPFYQKHPWAGFECRP